MVSGAAVRIREQVAVIRAHAEGCRAAVGVVLGLAGGIDPGDEGAVGALLEAVEAIGCVGQAGQGQVTLALAQARRVGVGRVGLVPWVSAHLDVTPGAARAMVESARELGELPELAEPLVSGRVGASTIRALTRTAQAVKKTEQDVAEAVTETLDVADREGVGVANRHVRILEQCVEEPKTAEAQAVKQRQRGFLRVLECGGGAHRIEGLLEAQQATAFKAALDHIVSGWLREGRCGQAQPVLEGVDGLEQMQVQALIHLVEAYATADAARSASSSTLPRLYVAHLDESSVAGRAQSAYGLLLPDPAGAGGDRHCTIPLDRDSIARLAKPSRHTALRWRDPCVEHHTLVNPAST